MTFEIREERASDLVGYATVSGAFEVREIYSVSVPSRGLGGIHLQARALPRPYVKDYDLQPENRPSDWPSQFDVSQWNVLSAWQDGVRIGGAIIAWGSSELRRLAAREDLAILWDLRIASGARGRGVGTSLFRAVEACAASRGAQWLEIETQNVNVAACRFYARQGCVLGGVHRFAYPLLPEETQLLWYKSLVQDPV
jgi:ribosomal protein S18 acetylase RimI-like enzyme